MGGQDATEAFEDVGHSDEAREILTGLLIGDLKRMVRLSRQLDLCVTADKLAPPLDFVLTNIDPPSTSRVLNARLPCMCLPFGWSQMLMACGASSQETQSPNNLHLQRLLLEVPSRTLAV